MDLSIIIVNYNVKALLEQTLLSVYKAIHNLQVEIIVVDNNSADESCDMVTEKFKDVVLIANTDNVGFSKANNQGIKISTGRNILLLNPDTVVGEDTLTKTVYFLDHTSDAGALGVRMIDGRGDFLPESKRGLPTPSVAFYKMSGLAKLFPKSKRFGAYHLSYLNEHENHKADILSGAFLMVKKSVLEQVGLLDESFFMYGEDIDLSYRIIKAGYSNYYFADTTIIHYKGESTKKHSVNYVKIFYLAMAKFADKHYTKQQGWWFSLCINLAIFVRAAFAVFIRSLNALKLFTFDFLGIFIGYYGLMRYWEIYNKYVVGGFYPPIYIQLHVPIYILMWLSGIYIAGGYNEPFKLSKTVKGVFLGSFILLAIYALMPENLRYSRALILLGSTWTLLLTVFIRICYHFIKFKHFDTSASQMSQVLIVGNKEECERVKHILLNYPARFKLLGFIKPKNEHAKGDWIGGVQNLALLIEIYKANEIIFCTKDISSAEIMNIMGQTNTKGIKFKIMPEMGAHIIGSNSKNTTGEFYSVNIAPALSSNEVKKGKRYFDLIMCAIFLVLAPILLFRPSYFLKIFRHWKSCLNGNLTWVSYQEGSNNEILPKIPNGVFSIGQELSNRKLDAQLISGINFNYALNYHWQNDLNCLAKVFFSNNFATLKSQ